MDLGQPQKTWVESHEHGLRLLIHSLAFLLLAPAYGSPCLPLFDYPIWQDYFESSSLVDAISRWDLATRVLGSQGRFVPLFLLIQGLISRLNHLPQLGCWLFVMAAFQISTYLLYRLIRLTGKSPGLALMGCAFFVFNPYTLSTYWMGMNTEIPQIPFVLGFLIFACRFLSESGSGKDYLYALLLYALALFSKESSLFLLPALLIQALIASLLGVSSKKNALTIVTGSLLVTALWGIVRLIVINPGALGNTDSNLVNLLPIAVFKRVAILSIETTAALPCLVIGTISLALQISYILLRRRDKSDIAPAYPAIFLFISLAAWLAGLSLIAKIEVRYLVPLIMLAVAVSVQSYHCMRVSARRVFWAVAVIMLLNNFAAASSARDVMTGWNRLEGDMVRSISELPRNSVVFCGATYRSSDIRFAQRITWSLDKFFGRRDIMVQPLSSLSQPPLPSYLLISDERFVSQWCNMGWHPGGLPESRLPADDLLAVWQKDRGIELAVHGWQLRGWHFLVLAKRLLTRTPTDMVPFGPTFYEARFTLYRHPSLSPRMGTDLPGISIRDYVKKSLAERSYNHYRLLNALE